jgi:hypothetical protein
MSNIGNSVKVVRDICTTGHKLRQKLKAATRIPLNHIVIITSESFILEACYSSFGNDIEDELNVRSVRAMTQEEFDNLYDEDEYEWSENPKYKVGLINHISLTDYFDGLMRDFSHQVNNLRKERGMQVTDKADLVICSLPNDKFVNHIMKHYAEFCKETCCDKIVWFLQTDTKVNSLLLKKVEVSFDVM